MLLASMTKCYVEYNGNTKKCKLPKRHKDTKHNVRNRRDTTNTKKISHSVEYKELIKGMD